MLKSTREYRYLLDSNFISFRHVPKSGISGSYSSSTLYFLRQLHTVSHDGYTEPWLFLFLTFTMYPTLKQAVWIFKHTIKLEILLYVYSFVYPSAHLYILIFCFLGNLILLNTFSCISSQPLKQLFLIFAYSFIEQMYLIYLLMHLFLSNQVVCNFLC